MRKQNGRHACSYAYCDSHRQLKCHSDFQCNQHDEWHVECNCQGNVISKCICECNYYRDRKSESNCERNGLWPSKRDRHALIQ
jgi:hypothetical protein